MANVEAGAGGAVGETNQSQSENENDNIQVNNSSTNLNEEILTNGDIFFTGNENQIKFFLIYTK